MDTQQQSARGGLSYIEQFYAIAQHMHCSNKKTPYLRHLDHINRHAYYMRPACGQWTCPECGQRLRKRWAATGIFGTEQLQGEGESIYFWTITSHERNRTLAGGIKAWRSAWPKLYAKIKREDKHFAFIMIPEHVEGQGYHVHMLSSYNPQDRRWIKDEPRKRGLGYINEIEPVASKFKAGFYCAKYLSKDMVAIWPKNFRRVRKSKWWPSLPERDHITEVSWYNLKTQIFPSSDAAYWAAIGYEVHKV